MSEAYSLNKEFLFKTSIYEITSISIEHNYDIDGANVEGEFIISGDYRLHEISINKEDFSFRIPFKHEIKDNINLDTVDLEITDFKYELQNDDELKVNVDYVISGEQELIEIADEKELDNFLLNNAAEVVNLSEENSERKEEPLKEEAKEATKENSVEEREDDTIKTNENTIINSINSDETYVKYHVHVVNMNDTIEGITAKYNVTLSDLKKYNTFENLELNMKLIIPENEEN